MMMYIYVSLLSFYFYQVLADNNECIYKDITCVKKNEDNVIVKFPRRSYEECQEYCNSGDYECAYWSYYRSTRFCYLLSSCIFKKKKGVISGPRYCPSTGLESIKNQRCPPDSGLGGCPADMPFCTGPCLFFSPFNRYFCIGQCTTTPQKSTEVQANEILCCPLGYYCPGGCFNNHCISGCVKAESAATYAASSPGSGSSSPSPLTITKTAGINPGVGASTNCAPGDNFVLGSNFITLYSGPDPSGQLTKNICTGFDWGPQNLQDTTCGTIVGDGQTLTTTGATPINNIQGFFGKQSINYLKYSLKGSTDIAECGDIKNAGVMFDVTPQPPKYIDCIFINYSSGSKLTLLNLNQVLQKMVFLWKCKTPKTIPGLAEKYSYVATSAMTSEEKENFSFDLFIENQLSETVNYKIDYWLCGGDEGSINGNSNTTVYRALCAIKKFSATIVSTGQQCTAFSGHSFHEKWAIVSTDNGKNCAVLEI